MRLTLLTDNHTLIDRYYEGEPAFSCLVEDDGHTILFDTGYSGMFMENAAKMGKDLSHVTDIVISHGHNDHTGGLIPYFQRFSQLVKLYAHPLAFHPKRQNDLSIGAPALTLPAWVSACLTKEPQWISRHVLYLGEIPRVHPFEAHREVGESFCDGHWESDRLYDDTSLAVLREGSAPLLLTGCAHSGVCNTFSRAASLLDRKPDAILGGMHLFDADADFQAAMLFLLDQGVREMYPAHCTSLEVKSAMLRRFITHEVGVGTTIEE